MPKIKVAITGTIGSGKTTVCKALKDLGYEVFISDDYNATLLDKGNVAYNDIVKNFDVLDENLNIDKKKLASIVFNDPSKLKLLESFTTNRVILKIKELLKADEICFFEVPLLYELKLEKLFDLVIVVTSDKDIRINRLIERGISKEDAFKRIENQISDIEKIAKADYVLINDGDKLELYDKIIAIIKEINHD